LDVVREPFVVTGLDVSRLNTLFQNGVATRWAVERSVGGLRHAEESKPDTCGPSPIGSKISRTAIPLGELIAGNKLG
jgi:hypothetical protein